jgi:hypothetical protein
MLANRKKRGVYMQAQMTERLKITMTAAEKEMIKRKAAAANMTVSEFLRALIENKKLYAFEGLPDVARQLIKVGVNASQISFVARTCGDVSAEKVEELNNNIGAIQDEFAHLLRVLLDSKDRNKPRFYSRPESK